MSKSQKKLQVFYDFLFASIALGSFLIVSLSLIDKSLRLNHHPFSMVMNILLFIYTVDFTWRLFHSHRPQRFIFDNTFDLLSLIPFHPAFAIFRIGRVFHLIRRHHLLWRLGWDGKFSKAVHRFVYSTGFLNLFSVSMFILVLSSLLFSIVEKRSFPSALWWAITTATTVGYGDISPTTDVGRFIAAFLMIGGVGFIGLLTSTITGFFTAEHTETPQHDKQELIKKLDQLNQKIDCLEKEIKDIKK